MSRNNDNIENSVSVDREDDNTTKELCRVDREKDSVAEHGRTRKAGGRGDLLQIIVLSKTRDDHVHLSL